MAKQQHNILKKLHSYLPKVIVSSPSWPPSSVAMLSSPIALSTSITRRNSGLSCNGPSFQEIPSSRVTMAISPGLAHLSQCSLWSRSTTGRSKPNDISSRNKEAPVISSKFLKMIWSRGTLRSLIRKYNLTVFAQVTEQIQRYKNWKCEQHNKFFETNIYQKNPNNKHHWRLNIARPSNEIDL